MDTKDTNESRSDFLAMMSHELRTPLNSIVVMTHLLLETPLTPEQAEYAEKIRTSGENLLEVIKDILDFSKIESGKMEIEKHPFSLASCIEETLDLLAPGLGDKRVELLYDLSDQVPFSVNGDASRVRQILINLVGNAVKFTQTGEISVTAEKRREDAERVEILVEVRDTGIGIPIAKWGKLFKAFSQVDSSTARKYGGTGLGLAITKRLVELMNGRIWVESEEGRGTTFFLTLWFDKDPSHAEPPRLSGKKLMVLWENAKALSFIEKNLRRLGHDVFVQKDAESVLAALEGETAPDCILVDQESLSEMGLAEFGRRVREAPGAKNLPMILFLPHHRRREQSPERFFYFAAQSQKPVKYSHIRRLLERILGIGQTPSLPGKKDINRKLAETLPMKILVADDDPDNRKIALILLSKMGYQAVAVENGRAVLAHLAREAVDLVFMDMRMPDLTGLETTKKVREEYAGRQPFIVALTANALREEKEKCLAGGMDDYLSKPIQIKDFQEVIRRFGEKLQKT